MSTDPYYSDDLVTLYHGDCREVTAWLNAAILVTDPPYGIGWSQAAYKFTQDGRRHETRVDAGIQNDCTTGARDEALSLWGARRRALVFGSPLAAPPVGTRQVLVWKKPSNSGLFGAVGGYRRDIEFVYMLGDWSVCAPQRSAVISTGGSVNGAGVVGHPHAKPLALMETLLGSVVGGVIADPFAGSGSTLVAAKLLGWRAIGVEIDERYCEIAARRLSQDVLPFEESA